MTEVFSQKKRHGKVFSINIVCSFVQVVQGIYKDLSIGFLWDETDLYVSKMKQLPQVYKRILSY